MSHLIESPLLVPRESVVCLIRTIITTESLIRSEWKG